VCAIFGCRKEATTFIKGNWRFVRDMRVGHAREREQVLLDVSTRWTELAAKAQPKISGNEGPGKGLRPRPAIEVHV